MSVELCLYIVVVVVVVNVDETLTVELRASMQ